MSSNYSTNLKIELISTGEQAGTWGDTTNTNLGTALEEAIVGYGNPNFTSNADLSISLTNSNSEQVARNLVLNVTSDLELDATYNLIVPTIEKPYIVQNNTTGTQSIVVKTSGGSGVTIPNGKSAIVYADGTNVVSQIDHIPSLTLGAALPVASGGTGLSTVTANNVLLGNGTSAFQEVAPGTSGNVLASNGTTWASTTLPPGFDAGTRMIFAQDTAPTGWTKDTTNYNEHALRVTTGTASTGGSVDFTSAFATPSVSGSFSGTVDGHTLTTSQIPSHTHGPGTGSYFVSANSGNGSWSVGSEGSYTAALFSTATAAAGGGGSHSHTYSGSLSSGSAAINVKYLDVITATKD